MGCLSSLRLHSELYDCGKVGVCVCVCGAGSEDVSRDFGGIIGGELEYEDALLYFSEILFPPFLFSFGFGTK